MCGIFCYRERNTTKFNEEELVNIRKAADYNSIRGPDATKEHILYYGEYRIYLVFYRLAIVDLSENGMQPFIKDNYYCICNGEIYNHKQLRESITDYNFVSNSDCEVILPLYLKNSEKTFQLLDGEFAIIIVHPSGAIVTARDGPYGVRSLFHYISPDNANSLLIISSTYKSIVSLIKNKELLKYANQVPAGVASFYKYYEYSSIHFNTIFNIINNTTIDVNSQFNISDNILVKVHDLIVDAVHKRIDKNSCHVKFGVMLSGGLDSSIVAAIIKRIIKNNTNDIENYDSNNYENNIELHSFSIGLGTEDGKSDSSDLKAAKIVAETLGTIHHEVIITFEEAMNNIEDTINLLETYDQTTIFAGLWQNLLAKWIKKNTDIIVILNGETADELNLSYRCGELAPTKQDAQNESIKLMNELCYYDILRADKATTQGLESRVPFSDSNLIKFMSSIDIDLRRCINGMEKRIIRMAFDPEFNKYLNGYDYLPKELLWRRKEAFSNGVGPFLSMFKEKIDQLYSDQFFLIERFNPLYTCSGSVPFPTSKDELHFRIIFNKFFPNSMHIIPHKWVPNQLWTNITESSATYLLNY